MRLEADCLGLIHRTHGAASYGLDVVRLIREVPEAATPQTVWFLAAVAARIARRDGGAE
jgi:hypothetical protein